MFLFGFLLGLSFGIGLGYAAWRYLFNKPAPVVKIDSQVK